MKAERSAAREAEGVEPPRRSDATCPGISPKHVLITEDDDAVADFYRRALRTPEYAFSRARSGEEALSLMSSTSFDAIVSDLVMPGMDGIQLLKSVREHHRDVPFVIVTGKPAVESAITALECGALRYLVKPVRPEELRDVVARAVSAKASADRNRRAPRGKEEVKGSQLSKAASESDFRSALESLYLAYQPIVAPVQGRVLGYEALVRSRSERLSTAREIVTPAEDFDAIHELGRAVRCAVANVIGTLPCQAMVFVNLHPRELLDEELFTSANPLRVHARRVVMELTEQARVEHVEERVNRLRSLGYLFAVDDLGAGYAALTHLVRFEPDFAKIDLDLVRDIDDSESKRMLVASLVHLCRELGVRLVCEGVETEAEGRCLLGLGAELLQGYYFARPEVSFEPELLEELQGRVVRLAAEESQRPLAPAESSARSAGDPRDRGAA